MDIEEMQCPWCKIKLRTSAQMSDDATVRCSACEGRFKLGDARRQHRAALIPSNVVHAVPTTQTTVQHHDTTLTTTSMHVPSRQTVATQIVINKHSNEMGVTAFVLSIVAFLFVGCLSPISLIFSLIAIQKPPRGMASAALILSLIGMLPMTLIGLPILIALSGMPSAKVREQRQRAIESLPKAIGGNQSESTSSKVEESKSFRIEATNVKQNVSEHGGITVSMLISNRSPSPIAKITLLTEFRSVGGKLLGSAESDFVLDKPIPANGQQQFQFRPQSRSELSKLMPDFSTGECKVLSAFDTAGQKIPIQND